MKSWRVPIGGHIYEVIFVRKGPAGEIDPNKRTISLNKKELTDEEKLLATYLHEVIHGYQFESGWHELVGEKLREIWAEGLASQLLGSFEMKIKKY